MPFSESVTQMLIEWHEGDESALERLTPLVYDELRRRAAAYLRRESDAETLQATALVHEAYLQILDLRNIDWKNRAHFINTIALLMRRILVDNARARHSEKRGSGERQVPLSRAERISEKPDLNLVALDEALEKFSVEYPRQTRVVELKFFGGLNTEEIAKILQHDGVKTSPRTVERDWDFARAWLQRALVNE
ncbi:MAG: ECF-type sigma factor [Acidobacteriota bacterium]|nr:ECF-type sigma factor [Acidobacteriota bacterium]